MSVANEVFSYWSSLGRVRKTTGGQKKIWIVILRYLKVIPFSHCASPRTHNFATSKEAAIFTGRIKRGNCGRFVVLMLLTAILIIRSGWKDVFLEIRPSPIAQNDHLKPKLSIWCRFAMKRERWPTPPLPPPPFYLCFLLVMATQKIYVEEKKNWRVEVLIFRYKWREFPHLEQQRGTGKS